MNSALRTQDSGLSSWLSHLEGLHPKSIELGLERVLEVKDRLGLSPGFPIITVGGTNGKGSACAMLESILAAAGYRVGLYTSPHLLRYNERVRIDKKEAGDAELCQAFAAVEAVRGGVSLTYFEFGTLAAVWLFVQRRVDVAVLEVGLGGRLDAVNAFDADCAILTSVDLDHMDYLGTTREAIGREKAGIFRSGQPAIYAEAEAPQSVVAHAQEIGAPLYRFGRDFGHCRDLHQWHFQSGGGMRLSLPYPALRGAYQLNNASACLAALGALKDRLPVTPGDICRGLREATVPGRFQLLPGRPQVILDVAHNPHAAAALAANLAALPPAPKTIAVFAMLGDKDIGGVVRALKSLVQAWFVAGIGQPRGASGQALVEILEAEGVPGASVCLTVEDAFRCACDAAGEDDRIVVFGSFHTVADVLRRRGDI
jgi:dihydrofolate synthase/folylpolyglutamate synthase